MCAATRSLNSFEDTVSQGDTAPMGMLDAAAARVAAGETVRIRPVGFASLGTPPVTWRSPTPATTASGKITEVADLVQRSQSREQVQLRAHAEIEAMFTGFELVEPGVVGCGLWHPAGPGDISDEADLNVQFYAGVGRKP